MFKCQEHVLPTKTLVVIKCIVWISIIKVKGMVIIKIKIKIYGIVNTNHTNYQ